MDYQLEEPVGLHGSEDEGSFDGENDDYDDEEEEVGELDRYRINDEKRSSSSEDEDNYNYSNTAADHSGNEEDNDNGANDGIHGYDGGRSTDSGRWNGGNEGKQEEEEEAEEEEDAPTYTPEQLTSLLAPVSITMLFASVIIVNVRSASIDDLLSTSLGTYAVSSYIIPATSNSSSETEDDDSIGFAILNAAVIIAGIALLTFGIVLCYKFRCYKFLYGFFTFTIFVALGFETGQILYAFFEKFQVAADWASLCFILYNFAIVGAVGILYGKIVPRILTQGYLVCISICICYLLRYFPEWTGWILLVLLALWDLFAVLAPCGPLKALVKMASERQDPIPGLLYTANASTNTTISVARRTNDDNDFTDDSEEEEVDASPDGVSSQDVRVNVASEVRAAAVTTGVYEIDGSSESQHEQDNSDPNLSDNEEISVINAACKRTHASEMNDGTTYLGSDSEPAHHSDEAHATALARIEQMESDARMAEHLHNEELSERTAAALAAENSVDTRTDGDDAAATAAAVAAAAAAEEEEEEEEPDRSVKLGLGDFIFYSLLVGKAALAGYVPFIVCFVVILCGLISTMILLALLKKPLPALPFSMLFGVTFFFWAQYTLSPQASFMALSGLYV